MKHFGPTELLTDVLQNNFCIGCGACIDLCPYFRSYKGKTAMLFPCTRKEGRCFAFCPKVEVDLDAISQHLFGTPYDGNSLGSHIAVKMSHAGPRVGKASFQAGGTVSAVIKFALDKGYINGAILTDRDILNPVPKLVTNSEDVLRCASSKYTASPTLSAFNKAVHDGYDKLGIVATPCQAMAIAQMRMNPLAESDFKDPTGLVVGLFCTWALDYRSFEAFLAQHVDLGRIKKIDIPPPPAEVLEVYLDEGKLEFPLAEIRAHVPDTCTYCIDMTSEFSDISVGVMEGRPDMNTLIIRTERGQTIVDDAEKDGYLILDDMPDTNLDHLTWAAGNKKKRALSKACEQQLINTSGKEQRAYLRLNVKTLGKICA